MIIELGKLYKTREGQTARITATDAPGKWSCIGYVWWPEFPGNWELDSWTSDGISNAGEGPSNLIVEHREPREWTLIRVDRKDRVEWLDASCVIQYAHPDIPRYETIRVREVLDP